jgi:histone H3/H4
MKNKLLVNKIHQAITQITQEAIKNTEERIIVTAEDLELKKGFVTVTNFDAKYFGRNYGTYSRFRPGYYEYLFFEVPILIWADWLEDLEKEYGKIPDALFKLSVEKWGDKYPVISVSDDITEAVCDRIEKKGKDINTISEKAYNTYMLKSVDDYIASIHNYPELYKV